MLLLLKHRLALLSQLPHSIKQSKMSRRASPVNSQRLSSSSADRGLHLPIIGNLLLLLLLLSSLLLSQDRTLSCLKSLMVNSKVLGL